MKYTRGTVLKWTKKALNSKREGASQRHVDDRMVVLSHDEVMFTHHGVVEQLDMYKSQDSYVEPCMPWEPWGAIKEWRVDRDEVRRCVGQSLVTEFHLKVTKTYEGRRPCQS